MSEESTYGPAYETKHLTLFQRFRRSAPWWLGALLLAVYAGAAFFGGHVTSEHWVVAGSMSTVFFWVSWRKWSTRVVTELATVFIPMPKAERIRAYFIIVITSACGVVLLSFSPFHDGSGIGVWVAAGLILLLLSLVFAASLFSRKELTHAAKLEKDRLEATKNHSTSDDSGVFLAWILAISGAIALFVFAPWWAAIIIILLMLILLK